MNIIKIYIINRLILYFFTLLIVFDGWPLRLIIFIFGLNLKMRNKEHLFLHDNLFNISLSLFLILS